MSTQVEALINNSVQENSKQLHKQIPELKTQMQKNSIGRSKKPASKPTECGAKSNNKSNTSKKPSKDSGKERSTNVSQKGQQEKTFKKQAKPHN